MEQVQGSHGDGPAPPRSLLLFARPQHGLPAWPGPPWQSLGSLAPLTALLPAPALPRAQLLALGPSRPHVPALHHPLPPDLGTPALLQQTAPPPGPPASPFPDWETAEEIESGLPPQSGTQGAYWRHKGTPPQGLFLHLCLFHLLKWERGWGASVLVKGPRPPAPHADLETPRSLGPSQAGCGGSCANLPHTPTPCWACRGIMGREGSRGRRHCSLAPMQNTLRVPGGSGESGVGGRIGTFLGKETSASS